MKYSLSWVLAGMLLIGSTGCVFVRVEGGLDDEFWDEDSEDETGFHDLTRAVEGSLSDPRYVLDLHASPWGSEAEWAVTYATEGSDGAAAFHKVREAVLARVRREGGHVRSQKEEGPLAWSCKFHVDGERGAASVRLVEDAEKDPTRPHRLEVVWEQTD